MRILLADDDRSLRRVLQFKLEQNGHEVSAVADGAAALVKMESTKFDLLLSDIRMPKMGGIELLERAKSMQPELKVILITAHATVSQAVQAVKLGAFDYITKPFEDEELLVTIEKAFEFKKLESENITLRKKLQQVSKAPKLIGVSVAFKQMMSLVNKIAETDATVLITGESGTGKELIAKTLHYKSGRSSANFVAINCAAIPKDLLESELFGHVRGSFTGAVKDKKGKFEMAGGGTLFLDEVGDMAGDLQAKLLRALQERVIEPVGSEQPVEVDVRVIGATNSNLQEQVAKGAFREDLYYRLNVIPIQIPSLKERREDISILVQEFIKKFSSKDDITVSPQLMEELMNYSWPGNVRELENLVERMIVLRRGKTLTSKDLPEEFGTFDPKRSTVNQDKAPTHLTFREAEISLVSDALERCGWNRTKAAKFLNVPRHVLIYRMRKYGIEESESL
ncbi:MAG: sigma-54 dependent transcriptional regulator [bacterium]|nr:sigma-54 dependent transcriptional regulator [bacterium]